MTPIRGIYDTHKSLRFLVASWCLLGVLYTKETRSKHEGTTKQIRSRGGFYERHRKVMGAFC